MLEHYNIRLIEDLWEPNALMDAASKDRKYRHGAVMPNGMDIYPISDGPVDQETDLIILQEDESGNPAPSLPPDGENKSTP
jgi:hypothetical protein